MTSRLFEGVRARSSSFNKLPFTIFIFISGCLYKLQQKPSPSTNLTLTLSCQPSPSLQTSPSLQSSLFSLPALPVQCRARINAYVDVTIFTKRYSVYMTIFSERYRQDTYVRTPRSNRTSPVRRLFASRFGARQ